MITEGKVIFQRDEHKDCSCCKGKHVFSTYVEWNKNYEVHPAFENDYLRGLINKFIQDKEGKKIRITIEEVAETTGSKSK